MLRIAPPSLKNETGGRRVTPCQLQRIAVTYDMEIRSKNEELNQRKRVGGLLKDSGRSTKRRRRERLFGGLQESTICRVFARKTFQLPSAEIPQSPRSELHVREALKTVTFWDMSPASDGYFSRRASGFLLPSRGLRLERCDVGVTTGEKLSQLLRLRQQGVRNLDILLEHGSVLLA